MYYETSCVFDIPQAFIWKFIWDSFLSHEQEISKYVGCPKSS